WPGTRCLDWPGQWDNWRIVQGLRNSPNRPHGPCSFCSAEGNAAATGLVPTAATLAPESEARHRSAMQNELPPEAEAKVVAKIGMHQAQRHIFLCCDQTTPKCCDKELSLRSWDFLKNR